MKVTRDLQSFLPKYQHEEIDEVCRYKVEKKDYQIVHELAIMYISARIPNLPLERVLISEFFPFLQYLSPSDRYHATLRNIINRYTCFPSEKEERKNYLEKILTKRIICKKKNSADYFSVVAAL